MKKYIPIIFNFFLIFILLTTTSFAAPVPRPPQYVLLAFDGSLNLDMWNETLIFAKKNKVKLSYFLSGVYFLLDSNRLDYTEPSKGPGHSAIGFAGGSINNLVNRVSFVNKAYDEGHTIGSHANGHFDGTKWTLPQWELELKEFNHLIFDVYSQIGFDPLTKYNPYHFRPDQIVGFRAPLLATNANLYKALRDNKFAYDTSQTAQMNYWPENIDGLWNFPLAELRIFDTGKKTLSMDYNFYFSESGGNPDLENADKYRAEMLKTYMGYFYTNYYGNRAPIHIGHHFSKWNGGAYWQAFGQFVKSVCSKPEVKCVSYQSLLKFMNSVSPATINEYQKGNFPKLTTPPSKIKAMLAVAPIDVTFSMNKINEEQIELSITGRHANIFHKNSNYIWMLNDKEFFRSKYPKINISTIPKMERDSKLSAVLRYQDRDLLKTSHIINSNNVEGFILINEDLEKRATLGDLPEAHLD
jgi:peptidoglycan/xylan/chitin deacetylase (PgdA/CDA1 family)